MSAQGQVRHNAAICSLPLSEHSGNEPCLVWVEPEITEPPKVAHYKNGPQGNMVADFYADHLARSGPAPRGPLGMPEIVDRRDNRDPEEVGKEILAKRELQRIGKAEMNGTPR